MVFCVLNETVPFFLFQTHQHDLKPGGAEIVVTNENKKEYIQWATELLLTYRKKNTFHHRGFDANLLFCVWQSGDAVEVCEQDTEADDCLQRGNNLLNTFFCNINTVKQYKVRIKICHVCVLGILWVDTTRSDQDLWWERARGEFSVRPMCWN